VPSNGVTFAKFHENPSTGPKLKRGDTDRMVVAEACIIIFRKRTRPKHYSEKLTLFAPPSTEKVTKLRRKRWMGNVASKWGNNKITQNVDWKT
jgi:hypothetical protein